MPSAPLATCCKTLSASIAVSLAKSVSFTAEAADITTISSVHTNTENWLTREHDRAQKLCRKAWLCANCLPFCLSFTAPTLQLHLSQLHSSSIYISGSKYLTSFSLSSILLCACACPNLTQSVLHDPEAVCRRVFSCGESWASPCSRRMRKPGCKRPPGRGERSVTGSASHSACAGSTYRQAVLTLHHSP